MSSVPKIAALHMVSESHALFPFVPSLHMLYYTRVLCISERAQVISTKEPCVRRTGFVAISFRLSRVTLTCFRNVALRYVPIQLIGLITTIRYVDHQRLLNLFVNIQYLLAFKILFPVCLKEIVCFNEH